MPEPTATLRRQADRLGMIVSGLCAAHCVLGLTLVSLFGLGGSLLLDPAIHRIGLAVAVVIGAVAIGAGVWRHRRGAPLALAVAGLSLMALALAAGHGSFEAVATIAGVALVALAHWRNLRHLAR